MLQRLHIENYALISRLDLTLGAGFTVLTGETGAGKSIILGALGLICGQRADARALKQGATRCVVEAEFGCRGFGLEPFMQAHDLDFDGESLILRRELSAQGATVKSRAFANDTPVPLAVLKALGDLLIDIHSQHQNLLLGQQAFQLDVLDLMAADGQLRNGYACAFRRWQESKRRLAEARERADRSRQEEDYLRFQLEQLEAARLRPDEQADLEAEALMLSHADDIRQQLGVAAGLMNGPEAEGGGVVDELRRAVAALDSVADKMTPAAALAERLRSDYIDLQDAASELGSLAESVEVDPRRAAEVDERLQLLYDLERKHHVETDTQLLDVQADYSRRLADIDHADEQLTQLESECQRLQAETARLAAALSEARRRAAREVERRMTSSLQPLGMPHARFGVSLADTELGPTGADTVTFLFSGNKSGQPADVASVASGGEIARVMLCLKALIADAAQRPTLILDEIDTGLSGAVADKMGRMMQQMAAAGLQVLSITHLPQIAARGADHLRVYKDERGDTTESHIERLTPDERTDAIAHLLSGEQLTQAARDNARELLRACAAPSPATPTSASTTQP